MRSWKGKKVVEGQYKTLGKSRATPRPSNPMADNGHKKGCTLARTMRVAHGSRSTHTNLLQAGKQRIKRLKPIEGRNAYRVQSSDGVDGEDGTRTPPRWDDRRASTLLPPRSAPPPRRRPYPRRPPWQSEVRGAAATAPAWRLMRRPGVEAKALHLEEGWWRRLGAEAEALRVGRADAAAAPMREGGGTRDEGGWKQRLRRDEEALVRRPQQSSPAARALHDGARAAAK